MNAGTITAVLAAAVGLILGLWRASYRRKREREIDLWMTPERKDWFTRHPNPRLRTVRDYGREWLASSDDRLIEELVREQRRRRFSAT